MKRYFFIIITSFFLFGQYSCTDLLEQKPQGQWNEGDAIGGGFESSVFDIYALLRGFNVTAGNVAMAIHSFRSEDAEKGSTAGDGSGFAAMYDDFGYNASDGAIAGYWTGNYAIIHAANNVITDIESSTDAGEGTLINKAEAHFFRAFAYFNLVRAFGEVPLIDFKVSDAQEANIPKSPAADIYTLIDADLAVATEFLPRTWERYPGRLTWGAARAFHARTYMMRNDWQNMYAASTEVINSTIYDLDTPFDKIFREDGENSSESVFELQCTSTTALPDKNEIGSQFAQVQGIRGDGEWNLGWGWNTPTEILAAAFEEGDPRKDETLLYFYRSQAEADEGTIANAPWGEKPVVTQDVINPYYNKKAYTNPAWRAQYAKSGHWVNIRIIRYADVVLMAAESANELGNTSAARTYLEMVRSRARRGSSNTNILPEITTTDQAELRVAIRHERRIELAMEYDRFYDLVRWGTAVQVLRAAGKTNYQDKHALLPIPQNEVDKSNGVLKQNPNH
jgi:hypothetical protein